MIQTMELAFKVGISKLGPAVSGGGGGGDLSLPVCRCRFSAVIQQTGCEIKRRDEVGCCFQASCIPN